MNMNQTYCGKTCETCPDRERLSCPGCQQGPGRPGMRSGCPIAACCREKNHENCESCVDRGCSVRSRSANMVTIREEDAARAAAREARKQERIGVMNKYLPILWGLLMARLAIGGIALIGTLFSGGSLDALKPISDIAGWIVSIIQICFYVKMSSVEPGFKTAAVYLGIAQAISAVSSFLGDSGFAALIDIVVLIPSLYGQYSLYTAYASVLFDIDSSVSDQWERLWRIYRNTLIAIIPGFIFAMLNPVIAYFGVLALSGMMLYIIWLEYSNIYKTQKAFEAAK